MRDTQQSKEKEDTGQGCRMRTGTRMMRDSNKDEEDEGKERQRQQQQHNNQKIVEDVVTYCSGDSVEEGCGKLWCRRQGNCHLGVMQQ